MFIVMQPLPIMPRRSNLRYAASPGRHQLISRKSRLLLILLSAVPLALLACVSQETSNVAKEQNRTHLAKVQARSLDSVTEGDTVVYYSKGRETRGREVLALVGSLLARFTPTYGPLALHVAVLTESDWKATTESPYGVPGVRDPGPIAFLPADVEQGMLQLSEPSELGKSR